MLNNNYFNRQLGIIDPAILTKKIGIIGAGSIGSWTALALVKLGCQNVKVYDFDTVDEHNVGSQIYTSRDIGKLKVEALNERIEMMTEGTVLTENTTIGERTIPDDLLFQDIIILAVDNIETRKIVFDKIPSNWVGYLIDARMAGNAIEIYTLNYNLQVEELEKYKTNRDEYASTLFSPDDAIPVVCSMRSVVYNVFIIGGLIADLVAKISKNTNTPSELIMDLENLTLYGGLEK